MIKPLVSPPNESDVGGTADTGGTIGAEVPKLVPSQLLINLLSI